MFIDREAREAREGLGKIASLEVLLVGEERADLAISGRD
jgi:hypothetical protein